MVYPISRRKNPDDLLRGLFGDDGSGIMPDMDMNGDTFSTQGRPGGGAAPAAQAPRIPQQPMRGPTVIRKSRPKQQQGGVGGMPGLPSKLMGKIPGLNSIFGAGAGGASGGAAAGGASGGGGLMSGLSGLLSNPWTAIPAAAVAGASSLSADSAAAGTGANVENWLGPLYNIPEAMARGDWDDVFKDGAWGPAGAIYGLASGKDPVKSIANSFGPLGQIPYLLFKGELPYSGGKTSRHFMNAFQGRGV